MKDFAILANLRTICDIVLTLTEQKSQSPFNLSTRYNWDIKAILFVIYLS